MDQALSFLATAQNPDSGWHTTVAIWGLALARTVKASGEVAIAVSRGADWLLANRSRSLPLPNPATKLIGRLAGWSWTPGTFGWVIPTGLGLMALGAASPGGVPDSATDAVSLLVDRRCSKGGWNWGNPVLFGTELPPYATETAIAVLGLLAAGREASDDSVKSGLDWLASNLDPNTGVTATAWAILALRAGGRDASSAIARLRGMQASDGGWRASPHATALAYLALRSGPVL